MSINLNIKSANKPKPKPVVNIFQSNEDKDKKEEINDNPFKSTDFSDQLQFQNNTNISSAAQDQYKNQIIDAMIQDPDIYDYDKYKDNDIVEKKLVVAKAKRQPRYLEKMLKRVDERKREMDIYFERGVQKERETEDHKYKDKDIFITSAYKKKLIEDKKWLEEQSIKEQKELNEDVRKRKGMAEFYKNMISDSNISIGKLGGNTIVNGEDISNIDDSEITNIDLNKIRDKNNNLDIYIPIPIKNNKNNNNSNGSKSNSRSRSVSISSSSSTSSTRSRSSSSSSKDHKHRHKDKYKHNNKNNKSKDHKDHRNKSRSRSRSRNKSKSYRHK